MESAACRCSRCSRGLTRRWFLGAAGALLVAAPPAIEIVRQIYAAPLLPALPPGWAASKDGVGLYTISHPLSSAEFRKLMVAELNQVFEGVYNDELVVSTFNEDALEEIEIDVAIHS